MIRVEQLKPFFFDSDPFYLGLYPHFHGVYTTNDGEANNLYNDSSVTTSG